MAFFGVVQYYGEWRCMLMVSRRINPDSESFDGISSVSGCFLWDVVREVSIPQSCTRRKCHVTILFRINCVAPIDKKCSLTVKRHSKTAKKCAGKQEIGSECGKKFVFFSSTSTSCREKFKMMMMPFSPTIDARRHIILLMPPSSHLQDVSKKIVRLWHETIFPWKSVYYVCDSTTASIWWCIGMLLPACSNRRCMPPTKLRVWFPSTICRHSRTGRGLARRPVGQCWANVNNY